MKIEAYLVNAGLYMAFKHCTSFATYLAANNLVAINSEHCQTLFPSFCAQPSELAVLFCWNLSCRLSTRPFLGPTVALDLLRLLLCTGFDLEDVDLFLYQSFAKRPMNDRKIEPCFGW